ncbi:recombinase family protein [Candidatus Bipolaricaulota bacterium]
MIKTVHEKAIAYIRVSTPGQEEYSPETQREYIARYAEARGYDIAEWFEETQSGWRKDKPRREFERMDEYLTRHPDVQAVLLYKLDRLARNDDDFARHFGRKGYRLIAVTEEFPDSAAGRMGQRIIAATAIGYSEALSERVRHGQQTKATRGEFPGGGERFGYTLRDGGLEIEPEQAAAVRELYDAYERPNMTLAGLAKYAKDRGFRTVKGNAFGVSSLRLLLTNPLYYGGFRWKGEIYEGVHEPIVSRHQFDRVQRKLQRGTGSVDPERFPYKELLVCHACGCGITGLFKKGRYTYYRCTGGRGDCEVLHKNVRQETMSARLAAVVDSVHLDEDQVRVLLRVAREQRTESDKATKVELGRLRSTLERIDADRVEAFTDKLHGSVDEELWANVDSSLQRRKRVVQSRIQQLDRQQGGLQDPEPALELLKAAPELYKAASHSQKVRILSSLVWNCEVDLENVYPNYKEPFGVVAQYNKDAVLSGGLNVERTR